MQDNALPYRPEAIAEGLPVKHACQSLIFQVSDAIDRFCSSVAVPSHIGGRFATPAQLEALRVLSTQVSRDDWSGVGGLLQLARTISAQKKTPTDDEEPAESHSVLDSFLEAFRGE